jgi:hypothetical protein
MTSLARDGLGLSTGLVRDADDNRPLRIPRDWSRQLLVQVPIIGVAAGFR